MIDQNRRYLFIKHFRNAGTISSFQQDFKIRTEAFHPFEYVKIAWETIRLGNYFVASGFEGKGCVKNLMKIHRCGITNHNLVIICANQLGHHAAKPVGQFPPPCVVPASDQILCPFLVQNFFHFLEYLFWSRTKGVSVKINHSFRKMKKTAVISKGVIPVKLLQFLKFHDGEIESEDGIVLDQLAFYSWFQSSNQFSIQRSINLILKEKTECQ